jgi:hypothetical protein
LPSSIATLNVSLDAFVHPTPRNGRAAAVDGSGAIADGVFDVDFRIPCDLASCSGL